MGARNMHKWEELRPEEFYEEFERAPIAWWACGPMEDHGLQNALGLDPGKAYEICLRAAMIAGGIVFPLVPFAPAGTAPSLSREELRSKGAFYPPSLWTSVELCRALYGEIFESMADLGFPVCLAFGGHGPARGLLQQMVQGYGGRVGAMRVWACGSATLIEDLLAEEKRRNPHSDGAHGGMWETSMNMALNPEYVDLSRVRDIESHPLPSQLKGYSEGRLRAIEEANAEFGERLIQTAAERLAAKGRELLAEARRQAKGK